MREIRLRAWDKKNELMLYVGSLSAVGDLYATKACEEKVFRAGGEEDFYERFGKTDYRWMLYVGLRDSQRNNNHRHGREIYDGDIMRDNEGKLSVVEYYDGGYMANCDGMRFELWGTRIKTAELEVVGNVYEHPHLIEGWHDGYFLKGGRV